MNTLPSLDEYFAAAERGEVSALYSPDRKYVKFKYTAHAIYSGTWNHVTMHARGHVFEIYSGKCVLRPWDKFFNFNELVQYDNTFTSIFRCMKIHLRTPCKQGRHRHHLRERIQSENERRRIPQSTQTFPWTNAEFPDGKF